MNNKTLIFIPTYNESENVEKIYHEINSLDLVNTHILFIDDNSPDGTGKLICNLEKKYNNVFSLHRSGKMGIGSAHIDAIYWAYKNKYNTLITLDCDFTHSPTYIPDLIQAGKKHDIVITSRFLKSDSLKDWNYYRKTMTILGHILTSYLLKIKCDATGAFRLYNLNSISKNIFNKIESKGYSFFFESLFYLKRNNISFKEIPIKLPARTYGYSKMKITDMIHSLYFIFHLFLIRLLKKKEN